MSNTMLIDTLSRGDIAIRYVYQKMFSPEGKLVAVECLSRFDRITVSPDVFFRNVNNSLREDIFIEQLAQAEQHRDWFLDNAVFLTINIDDHILSLLQRHDIAERIERLEHVHFEVAEYSVSLLGHAPVNRLLPLNVSLWLDDFGSGYAGIGAIRGYHFNYVKIDKEFFWHLIEKEHGRQLMQALITFLSKNNHRVIIEGVENEEHQRWLSGMEWFAMQGFYWQEVSIEQLVQEEVVI
ncbi:EAL domain-containing protein [Pantoea coffeiphila]|uniref:EAL domain-containing protein n=1 Tax=Pantoea coffeiphila TaxID=1465635 RepID=UPI0019609890|nr:EAL domain-containing protein [Pantoea coffeiphila]MBM7343213.1 EAL domain-containing protein (putative c-di-GMP-specific phosphodiesterase class I) [Pantoea coffeiphila]